MSGYFIVTGAAGFIGSNVVRALNARGERDIIAVDNLERGDKFRNLVDCEIADYFDKREFLEMLASGRFDGAVEAVLHQGACSDTVEADGRLENLAELIGRAAEFADVDEFIEQVSLVADTDELGADNQVVLMTLHSAKGLEYPFVFLVGCEEGIFPHNRALLDPNELESLLDYELETHHKETLEPAHAVQKVSDALPGFGIVAAVLGIVNTMSAIEGSSNAEIGMKVGAALTGTFLGILVAYGFVGPISAAMEARAHEDGKAFEVVKMALVASVRGYPPQVAVEFARKLLFADVRPTFTDLEAHLKGKPKGAAE